MQQIALYQSLLHQLSLLPIDYLQQVEQYVAKLNLQRKGKKSNREKILALAGAWSDLSEDDFEEISAARKTVNTSLFAREIEL